MADGSITFDTSLDNKQLERELAKLKKDIAKLEESATGQEAKKSPLVLQAQELEQKMSAARTEVERYRAAWTAGISGADKEQSAAIDKVRQLEAEHTRVAAQIDKIDSKLQPAYEKMDSMKMQAGGVAQELGRASVGGARMGQAIQKAGKNLDKFKMRLREVVRSALIFTLISQSIAKFRNWMGSVIKTNEEARAAIARLQGALLTLAQPLVEIIIPAFTMFVNILADIVGKVASLISTLFGSTVEESANAAENLRDEQDAINGVGDAAKKTKKSLANFDDINKLSGDDASSDKNEIKPDFSSVGNMDWLKETLGDSAGYVAAALTLGGIALTAIGACTGSLPLVAAGLLLIGSGISVGASTGALDPWVDVLGLNNVQEFVVVAVMLGGIALVALGAAFGNILLVLIGMGLIWGAIAYSQSSGMMNSWTEEQVSRAAGYIAAALILGGIVLIAIGAATANILMAIAGLGLLAAGIYVGVKSGKLKFWADTLGLDSVFEYVVAAVLLVGIALIAIGAAMGNIFMVIAGGILLVAGATAEVIGQQTLQSWWDVLKLTSIQQWVSVALLLVGIALIAIGAVMANVLMVIAGAAVLGLGVVVATQNNNLGNWVKTLGLEKVAGWVTAALMLAGMGFVTFGIFTANILMIVAGIGLLGAGVAVGSSTGTFGSWVDALGLPEVPGWVSTALLLGGIALVAIGAMTLNPLLVIAGLGLLGAGAVLKGSSASSRNASGAPANLNRSMAMPSVADYNVPRLARGAVIPPNREFLAVLGDQPKGTNIEAPVSEIEAAVARGVAAADISGRGSITIEFTGSLAQIGRVLQPVITSDTDRRGAHLIRGGGTT